MNGSVYPNTLNKSNLLVIAPDESTKAKINDVIFVELCQGIFTQKTINLFVGAIEGLRKEGAQCVILGCTEIPLIIDAYNSSLPVLDSTRLLAKYAIKLAVSEAKLPNKGWI